ncbi:MAG: hypothetical protein IJD53_07035 [Alistipes sp.]|nr:hypothetical protein [Alistipes sp.]
MKKIFTLLAMAASFTAIENATAATIENEGNNVIAIESLSDSDSGTANDAEYSEAYGRVQAYSTNFYNLGFYAGTTSRVVIEGDGDTDLDLYIYDGYGNLIAYDDDGLDYCVCEWYTVVSGYFSIQVVNRGGVYNDYKITVS